MKTNQPDCALERAFTRSDLLIVVALVLLLVAVQLPTFANTKSGSQSGTCANNLRRLLQAWNMVPNNGSDPNHLEGTWAAGWLDFTSSFDNINTDYLVNSERTGRYGLLGPYLKRDASVFKCPADRSQITIFGRVQARVRSVSMNNWLGGNSWASQDQFKVFRTMEEITRPEPSKLLAILDEREDTMNDSLFSIDMNDTLAALPASYHEGGANLAFADGHVRFRLWQDPRTVPVLQRGQQIPLQVPMIDNPDLEYLRSVATALK